MVAGLCRCLNHAGAQALAGHFQQAKAGNAAHLNARTIGLQPIFKALFNSRIIAPLFHVDVIDYDQTSQITQAQLAGNLIRGLQIGLQRGIFDRVFLGRTTRVHINRHQSFGYANHDITTGFQLNRRIEHRAKIGFHLIAGEKRQRFIVQFHVLRVRRHDHFHKVFGDPVANLTFNKHFVDVFVVQVTDRTLDQVAFFINLRRRCGFQSQIADLFPHPLQVFIITLYFGLGALRTRCTNYQTSAIWHFNLIGDFF